MVPSQEEAYFNFKLAMRAGAGRADTCSGVAGYCDNKGRVLLLFLVLHIFRVVVVVDVFGVFVLFAVAMRYVSID